MFVHSSLFYELGSGVTFGEVKVTKLGSSKIDIGSPQCHTDLKSIFKEEGVET